MSKIKNETTEDLQVKLVRYKKALGECDSPSRADVWKQIITLIDIELSERSQKKSDPQPTANREQLPTKPELEEWAKKVQDEGWNESKRKRSESEKIRGLSGDCQGETRVIGTITSAPVISIPVVVIDLTSGAKCMNRSEIMTMLKTWFKRVATSKAMEEGRYMDAYGGAMGQDTYKLFEAWNMIYKETKEGSAWPPMLDCFPGYKNASAVQKVNAELLWRWASNDNK